MSESEPDSGYWRLEDQIRWYDGRSKTAQQWFKVLKVAAMASAALIPLSAPFLPWLAGGLGVAVVILEGVQQLNQYHHNWVIYRSNTEALRHEKYLYLARSGPYDGLDDAVALKELARRVESLISTEHAKWVIGRERPPAKKPEEREAPPPPERLLQPPA